MNKLPSTATLICLLFSSLLANQSWAHHDEEPRDIYGLFQLGLTFGGDELAEVTVETDTLFGGDEEDTEEIKAGELLLLSGGLVYSADNFELQSSLGYYSDGVFGDNGEVTFTRWPLEVLGFWKTSKLRIGGGIAYHINPEFELDIDYQVDEEIDFDNALGFVLQVDYQVFSFVSIGVRYTKIEYETSEPGYLDQEFDGDSGGIITTFRF